MTSAMTDFTMWDDVLIAFPILGDEPFTDNTSRSSLDPDQWRTLVYTLQKMDMHGIIEDLVVEKIKQHLRNSVAKEFWKEIETMDSCNDGFDRFKKAVMGLARNYVSFLSLIQKLEDMRNILNVKRAVEGETDLMSLLKLLIRSTLHSQLPVPKHLSVVEKFYQLSFKVFSYSDKSDRELNESGDDVLQCGGCSDSTENCKCDEIITDFHNINRILIQLELLERLAGDVLTSLIHKQIESHVQETCKGSFDVSFIAPLEKWLDSVVVGWLSRLYSSGPECPVTQEKLNTFKRKLHHLLYETYTRTRIDQLFTIIIEYPDSDAAIEDLKICLEKTDLRPFLTTKLTASLQTRLLHPGVNTPDIITAYIASIRALRHLDRTGILLETCTQPVRQYLRGREDTMRCVVMSLTEEGPGDLAEELVNGEDSNQENAPNWEDWTPDPIDASDASDNKERQTWDIISMLVNVYGSKEIFVHEYRNLLADRLLVQYSYNTEKEVRYLELLKLRFGDSQLHYCEVMLKDIYDSKRLNTHLHAEPNFGLKEQEFEVTSMILSAQFWPVLKEEKLELPQKIKDHLDIYTKAYETIKDAHWTEHSDMCLIFFDVESPSIKVRRTHYSRLGYRTLSWKPHLGSVNLDIELKGRTVNLTVTPTQAAIIWYFQEKDQWTIEELSSVLHVPPTVLRRRIAYWQSQGLLKEVATDTFLLIEESTGRSAKNIAVTDMMCEDDEMESIMASAQDQREEELQVFWSYIVGMLTNLESLPPDRIHMMLKMFASQGPSAVECSLQQLKHFLDRKVRDHKLLFSGGFYRLPK